MKLIELQLDQLFKLWTKNFFIFRNWGFLPSVNEVKTIFKEKCTQLTSFVSHDQYCARWSRALKQQDENEEI
jgi:hypothetical protein